MKSRSIQDSIDSTCIRSNLRKQTEVEGWNHRFLNKFGSSTEPVATTCQSVQFQVSLLDFDIGFGFKINLLFAPLFLPWLRLTMIIFNSTFEARWDVAGLI